MGRDKALLPLPGAQTMTFVSHLATLLSSVCREVILVARDQPQADLYLPHLPSPIRVITDLTPHVGPLMGLYSGLRAMTTPQAVVTAVDMPFVQPALLTFLLSQAQPDKVVMPMVDDVPQVLLALYPQSVLPWIEQRLREGRRDPRSLLALVPVLPIKEAQLRTVDPQLRSFVNVNTPEELSFYSS
ncbi:putative molybdenum cofactor guanylyltransferase [Dictyobacter alpinus]|uniref:Putative molybdenum cofactor guanylyltransferase n=2 Tax=Dictyobacter alpinus TaxID=2014873 RepID=A0A402B7J7_9CHLR|nr:putative molybdenum cofactor guanylyltransferase [Dictyobacter alpinus]